MSERYRRNTIFLSFFKTTARGGIYLFRYREIKSRRKIINERYEVGR